MMSRYQVTVYNQHAMCGYTGEGNSRRAAFDAAMSNASREFLTYGGDWEPTLREMFDNIKGKIGDHRYAYDPRGVGVEYRKL
jgi:hypothetical protein